MLVAQFQRFCRMLHDEAAEVHLAAASATQRAMLRQLLTQGRRLDVGNPRSSSLGSDFGRLGFALIPALRSSAPKASADLARLEAIVDLRNAISHGDELSIDRDESRSGATVNIRSYRRNRAALNRLATTLDRVVAQELAQLLSVDEPW